MAIVYRHRRLDNNKVFYVGIGKMERRVDRLDQRNLHWTNTVAKTGFASEVVAKDIPWEDVCELESFMIELYGRRDKGEGYLVNMTDGGEGAFGRILSDSHKRRIGDAVMKAHPKGHLPTLEKVWRASKGRKYSKEEYEGRNYRKVYQYTLEGEFIREVNNAYQVLKELNISKVGRVCEGKVKSAGKFFWSYDKLTRDEIIDSESTPTIIYQYDLEDNLIERYRSINGAVNLTGIVKIGSVCNGKRKTTGGYYWSFNKR